MPKPPSRSRKRLPSASQRCAPSARAHVRSKPIVLRTRANCGLIVRAQSSRLSPCRASTSSRMPRSLTPLTVTAAAGTGRPRCHHGRVDTVATARDEPARRYDPRHILWYFGALAAALSASATVGSVGSGARGTYQLLVGLFFAAAFGLGAVLLLRSGWRVPGGVLAAATVLMVPATGQAFERLIGVWPSLRDD